MTPDLVGALGVFMEAYEYVHAAGFDAEVEWQRKSCLTDFSESDLLRESAWVILCTGFREKVVRRIFDHISLCFCDWESAAVINEKHLVCKIAARSAFRNEAKLDAIVKVAAFVNKKGFHCFKQQILCQVPHGHRPDER